MISPTESWKAGSLAFGGGLKLRRLVKTVAACSLHWTGADQVLGFLSGSRRFPFIVSYHRVVEDLKSSERFALPGMLISSRTLERHLDWMGRRFHFISLDEIDRWLSPGGHFNKPPAAITFDDGYVDTYYNAFPLLERKGIPAAAFTVAGLVGTRGLTFYDELYLLLNRAFSVWSSGPRRLVELVLELGIQDRWVLQLDRSTMNPYTVTGAILDNLPQSQVYRIIEALKREIELEGDIPTGMLSMTEEMILEMHRAGFTIGCHGHTHALLTNESFPKVLDELTVSRQRLESLLRAPVRNFAYPCGRFNAPVLSAVAASEYSFGYTICGHIDPVYPLLTLPRKPLWENSCLDSLGRFSSAIMSCQVNRVFDWINGCRQDHGRPLPPPLVYPGFARTSVS